jgi:uncharacterized membrane protein
MPKLLGHFIHPMLIVFPLGLFVTAIVFDAIHLMTGTPVWATVAYWMIASGIVGGLLAAVFGLADWWGLSSGSRAYRLGLWHGVGNVIVVGLFAISWLMRRGDPEHPSTLAFIVILLGGGLGLVTSWLGGELVERLGVGVDEGAHPNAPSSLSTEKIPRAGG